MAESNTSVALNNENSPKNLKSGQHTDSTDKRKTENVMRPILLEDYQYEEYPESLQSLMNYFDTQPARKSKIDILVGLIFILMLESGFVPSNHDFCEASFSFHYKRIITLSKNLPIEGSLGNRNYIICMKLPSLQQFEVKLTMVSASDDLIVNCFVKGVENGLFNVLLDPLKYFTSSNTDIAKIRFQDLKHLSKEIKDNIAFPAKHSILGQNGISFACLDGLPPEVIIMIMKKVPLADLASFGKTNQKYLGLYRDLMKKYGKKMQ